MIGKKVMNENGTLFYVKERRQLPKFAMLIYE